MTVMKRRPPLGLEDWSAEVWAPGTAPQSRGAALLEPEGGLAPVAMTGGLTGSVVDRHGLPAAARVVVRDRTGAVVQECYTGSARAASAGGRFEVLGLPTGSYVVEFVSVGFAPETRHGVRVEAPCITHLGSVRLSRADSPSITVQPRRAECLPFRGTVGLQQETWQPV